MAEEKKKPIEKGRKPIKPAGSEKGELSDEDIKRVAGGTTLAPVPPPKNMMPR